MNDTTDFYTTSDGVDLEIQCLAPPSPKGIFLVWPCTMGDWRMYRLPLDEFTRKGYTVILYNPRGHGRSGGQPNYTEAVSDLAGYLEEYNAAGLPLICAGHSGGGSALLNLGTRVEGIRRFFMVSPVLDSRVSLFHMYEQGTIGEFIRLLSNFSTKRKQVASLLQTRDWLAPDYWHGHHLREILDNASGSLKIGRFLEGLFITGMNAVDELISQRDKIEILLPSRDNWYPQEVTRQLARENGIPVTDSLGAKDHYFSRRWKHVWHHVLASRSVG